MTRSPNKVLQLCSPPMVGLALAAGLGAAHANPSSLLPPVQQQHGVRYLSGGIGHDEARAIEAAAPRWPVALEFAAKAPKGQDDAFLANVAVKIDDARHHTVLQTTSTGPFVLAQLQPGTYHVEARFDGHTIDRQLTVAPHGHVRELFVWPQHAEQARG